VGQPIRVDFQPRLMAWRGRLVSSSPRGMPVHAGSFLRQRKITMDSALLRNRRELARILVHELFHFVWLRLGNARRDQWGELLRVEIEAGVRGELGWSSAMRKGALAPRDWRAGTRRWRDYICESFCDTAAWWNCRGRRHEEFTLGAGAKGRRAKVFQRLTDGLTALKV
jgi:hypothetical protein